MGEFLFGLFIGGILAFIIFALCSVNKVVIDRSDYEKINKALKKQIPKKVELYINDGNFKWKNYPCPCCGEMLGLNVNKRYVSFCPKCGQALDWSDTDV